MKDFPFFTTQYGVASLTLKQIPYNGVAYITIQDSADPKKLLQECCDFCRAVGAKSVVASGHCILQMYPMHTSVVAMRCQREGLGDTDAALFPVQKVTLERFRALYNDAMKTVDNAEYMSVADAEGVLQRGNGYFVHRNGELLGIGIAGCERIEAIVAVKPGCGETVLSALNHALSGECVEVEVATSNERAVRLYERLGFVQCKELSRWYKII